MAKKREALGQSDDMWAHTMLTKKQTISYMHYKTLMLLPLSADTFRDAHSASAAYSYCVILGILICMHTHHHHDINLTKQAFKFADS